MFVCGCDRRRFRFLGLGRGLGVLFCFLFSVVGEFGTEGFCFLEISGFCGFDLFLVFLDFEGKVRWVRVGEKRGRVDKLSR